MNLGGRNARHRGYDAMLCVKNMLKKGHFKMVCRSKKDTQPKTKREEKMETMAGGVFSMSNQPFSQLNIAF